MEQHALAHAVDTELAAGIAQKKPVIIGSGTESGNGGRQCVAPSVLVRGM